MNCKVCGCPIYDSYEACPYCKSAVSQKKRSKGAGFFTVLLIIISVLAIPVGLASCGIVFYSSVRFVKNVELEPYPYEENATSSFYHGTYYDPIGTNCEVYVNSQHPSLMYYPGIYTEYGITFKGMTETDSPERIVGNVDGEFPDGNYCVAEFEINVYETEYDSAISFPKEYFFLYKGENRYGPSYDYQDCIYCTVGSAAPGKTTRGYAVFSVPEYYESAVLCFWSYDGKRVWFGE